MPTSVVAAAVAGAISGSAIVAGTLTLGFSWGAFASSLILGTLSKAMQKKPQQPEAAVVQSVNRQVNIRQPISSWQVIVGEAKVGGTVTFVEVVSRADQAYHTNNVLNLVITLAGHVCEEIGDVYFGDEVVPLDAGGNATGRWAGYAQVVKSLGDEAGQPFPDLVSRWSDGKWTDAHRQSGRTKIWVRLVTNPDLFPTGIPVVTCVVKGARIYDTRTATTAWSNNAALWTAHYLADATYGLGAVYADEIDTDDLDSAANICEEAVTLAAGGSEDRYTVNGVFTTSEKPQDVIQRLLTAMAGKAVNHGAKWHVYAGAYYAPTVTLSETDLAGSIRVQSLVSRRESCNGVKGVFTDPNSNWQPTDFPAIASATYMAQDNNERVWRDVDFSAFVTSGTQAQRLAKIELLRTRQGLTVSAPHKLTAFGVVPGRTAAINNTKFGFSAKAFDVEESAFSVGEDGALNVELAFRETAAAIYDWDTSEEQAVDIAPNTTLPDPFTVTTPGTLTVVEDKYETTGSAGVKSRATASWTALDGFGTSFSVEYKLSTDATYTVLPTSQGTSISVDDLAPGVYHFRHRAISVLGVRSAYSPVVTQELFGLTDAPSDVANFAVQSYSGQAKFTWTKPTGVTDLDVLIGGRTFVRWSPLTSGASWEHGSLVNPDGYPGDTSIGFGPLMSGTYMAKHRDSTGTYSMTEASFVVAEADLTGLTTITSVTESTTFTGSKTNVVASAGALSLDSLTLIDDILAPIDSLGAIDSIGGIQLTGSYTFANTMDLGSVTPARLFSTIGSLAFVAYDVWDSRTNDIDEWDLVDGAVVEDCEVQLMVRHTDDNPAGSPTWSGWHALGLVADYNHRAFQFRLDFTNGDPTHNRQVTSLSVTAKH